jgi:hypothetical protein
LKKPTGSVLKSKKPNRTQTKKPNQTEKTEPNRFELVFVLKKQTETGRFEPVSVRFRFFLKSVWLFFKKKKLNRTENDYPYHSGHPPQDIKLKTGGKLHKRNKKRKIQRKRRSNFSFSFQLFP